MHRLFAVSVMLLGVFAGSPRAAAEDAGEGGVVERLRTLPPEEQRLLLQRLKRWKTMSEEERERIRANLETFRALPRQDRKGLEGSLEKWRGTDPKDRREIEQRLARFKELPAGMKESLWNRFRRLHDLPAGERERILALPEEARRNALERLFLAEEVRRLLKRLSPSERETLADAPLEEQREGARTILQARRQAQLARMGEAERAALAARPPRERAKAEEAFLRAIHFRDQMLAVVLPGSQRAAFLKKPAAERDAFAREVLGAVPAGGPKTLSPDLRARWEAAGPDGRAWIVLEARFRSKLAAIARELLPSQRRILESRPLAAQWEKTQYYLKQNHRRLLSKLPAAARQELEPLPAAQQARRIRDMVRKELRKTSASALQRAGVQELPLLLQWDAVQRLRRKPSGR